MFRYGRYPGLNARARDYIDRNGRLLIGDRRCAYSVPTLNALRVGIIITIWMMNDVRASRDAYRTGTSRQCSSVFTRLRGDNKPIRLF